MQHCLLNQNPSRLLYWFGMINKINYKYIFLNNFYLYAISKKDSLSFNS